MSSAIQIRFEGGTLLLSGLPPEASPPAGFVHDARVDALRVPGSGEEDGAQAWKRRGQSPTKTAEARGP